MEQDGQHAVALQPLLLSGQHSRLQALVDGVESEHVALHFVVLQESFHVGVHLSLVAFLKR